MHQLHTSVLQERKYLVGNLSMLANLTDLRNMDRAISLQLEKYELVRMKEKLIFIHAHTLTLTQINTVPVNWHAEQFK